MNGILVAITVMTWTLESSGKLAIKATAHRDVRPVLLGGVRGFL